MRLELVSYTPGRPRDGPFHFNGGNWACTRRGVRVYSDKYLEDANSFAYLGGLLEGGRWSWYYPYRVVMLRESAPRRARFCYSADG
jgi:hypothetical protein